MLRTACTRAALASKEVLLTEFEELCRDLGMPADGGWPERVRLLRGRIDELQAANRELESFAFSLAHDLRAPLRHMDSFSRILLEDLSCRIDPQGVKILERISSASQRMALMIDALMGLAHTVGHELECTEVDLSAEAAAIAVEFRQLEPCRPVTTRIEEGIRGEGDPQLLRVVLQNLLGNAWKFTVGREDAVIHLGFSATELGEAVFVRDNGVGFDMRSAERLFKPFERLHRGYGGTGIGLASVQRIVTRHGGQVWAEGTPRGGATFYFTLPRLQGGMVG